MTIELNITTAPVSTGRVIKQQKQNQKAIVTTKKPKAQHSFSNPQGNDAIFQFNTNGTGKVKAIVARRRVKSTNDLKRAAEKLVLDKKENNHHNKEHKTQDTVSGDDLMLNVVTDRQTIPKCKTTMNENFKVNSDKMCQLKESSEVTKQTLESQPKHCENVVDNEEKFSDKKKPLETTSDQLKAKRSFPQKRMPGVSSIGLFKGQSANIELGQSLVKPITERIFSQYKVESLGLHSHAVKNLADLLSITRLTTVQQKTIPKILEGKDLLVRSQTGSGKTLAYALPIVEKLQAIRPKLTRNNGIQAVIIVPTRELAVQTYELFLKLVKPYTWLVPGVLMGGEKRKAEKARLRKGITILIGTPGRLVDHLLHTETFQMDKAQFLVLDEADRLLEMGYERDVQQIVTAINNQREDKAKLNTSLEPQSQSPSTQSPSASTSLQRLLLSATLTSAVQKLAGLTLQDPIFIDNSDEDPSKTFKSSTGYNKESIEAATQNIDDIDMDSVGILTIPENLKLFYVIVPPKLRLVTLAGLLYHEYSKKSKLKALVFMSTTEMVNYHHDLFNEQLTKKVLDDEDEQNDDGTSNKNNNNTDYNYDDDDDADDIEEKLKTSHKENASNVEPLLKELRFFKLHGSMSQTERQGVFKGFRECENGVLLATDVVGRGIDVPEIDLVVQYSPPQKTADFVHRVGRTARAGRHGRAILFLTPTEVQFIRYLENKRIRITRFDMDTCLKALKSADFNASTEQEAASNLQYRFEQLLEEDKEIYDKACKAFVSWMKFYTTFPKELKPMFNVKTAHMGHFAKSFCLKDAPTTFVRKHTAPKPLPPTNRLTYTERDPEKIKLEKKKRKHGYTTTVTGEMRNLQKPVENKLIKLLPSSRALTISEYDGGLPAPKKRKH